MIILEGPDNSGKSTLANAIQTWLGPESCYIIKSPASVSVDWDDNWSSWAVDHYYDEEQDGRLYILDRTPEISEPIYASIYRQGNIRNRDFLKEWQSLKQHMDYTQILFCMQNGDINEGVELTPDGSDTSLRNDMLVMSYALMYRLLDVSFNTQDDTHNQFNVAPYDYNGSNADFVEGYVKQHLNRYRKRYYSVEPITIPFTWPDDLLYKGDKLIDG